MVTVADIMTANVVTAQPDTTVAEAAQAMVKGRIGSAVVLQGSLPTGIITERDVLRAAASGSDLTESPVSRWMTSHPETAEPDLDSEQATEIMLSGGFRHLPVVETNRLVGIVSLRDVLSARIRRQPAED
jgi:CBS domain-containing protein